MHLHYYLNNECSLEISLQNLRFRESLLQDRLTFATCGSLAVGVDAVEDGLEARRGPGLVIYEAEAPCPEIPTSHHTALTPTTSV